MTMRSGSRSPMGDAAAAGLGLDVRAALARIELAASRLKRSALGPADARLAVEISAAVAEADEAVERQLALFAASTAGAEVAGDLRPAMDSLCQRYRPVLAARGIAWSIPELSGASIQGDAEELRRRGVGLLRAALQVCQPGDRVGLELTSCRGRASLELRLGGSVSATAVAESVRDLPERDAEVDVVADPGLTETPIAVRVWLTDVEGDSPCSA